MKTPQTKKPQSAKVIPDTAYAQGVKDEKARIDKKIDQRMSYYAETIGVMDDLDCSEGAKAAKIALEAVRRLRFEVMVDFGALFDGHFPSDEE